MSCTVRGRHQWTCWAHSAEIQFYTWSLWCYPMSSDLISNQGGCAVLAVCSFKCGQCNSKVNLKLSQKFSPSVPRKTWLAVLTDQDYSSDHGYRMLRIKGSWCLCCIACNEILWWLDFGSVHKYCQKYQVPDVCSLILYMNSLFVWGCLFCTAWKCLYVSEWLSECVSYW